MSGLTIRLSIDLLQKLRELAEANRRSLNSEILVALERYVKQEAGKQESQSLTQEKQ